jgi:hypothetical protein
MQSSEQFLEWTYRYRPDKGHAVGCQQHFVFTILFTLILLSFVILGVLLIGGDFRLPHPRELFGFWYLGFLIVLLILCYLAWLMFEKPNRKLRINQQTITLTDTGGIWGPKERRMSTTGAKFQAVHLDSSARIFTNDEYKMNSAYHIEITRSGESFLFPCNDEREQTQIIKQIKEFLA